MDNVAIARAFDELADLLELGGESPFKSRAYRMFADTARGLEEPLRDIVARGELASMEGVGKAIVGKVDELLRTGTCAALERARAEVPIGLLDVLRIPGLGAKTVRRLWLEANVTSLSDLLTACEEGRVAALPGFGARKQERMLQAVREALEGEGSMPLAMALEVGRRVRVALEGEAEAEVVGAARRGVEIVRELRVLVRGKATKEVSALLEKHRELIGHARSEIKGGDVLLTYEGGQRARVRPVDQARWLEALVRETGNGVHVRWLEGLAARHGGLGVVCAEASSEADVYARLGIPWAPPELRERATPEIPQLLTGVRGVFHVHSEFSDGSASIVEMARSAAAAGFSYVGISDHSKAAFYANGLDPKRLEEQRASIVRARSEVPEIAILHGVEVDILPDGSLDLDDESLAKLDFVIASVHSALTMSAEEMTARIVRAVSHPLVTMLGHPTGRLLLGRRGYPFDLLAVARAAAANETFLEINANAHRLDLSEMNVRKAAAEGARFVINPDAHAPHAFPETAMGVTLARRAGLTADQVLNARGADEVKAYLAERKARRLAARG